MHETQQLPPPVTARDVAQILRRRAKLAAVTFLVVVAGTLALTSRMKPVYDSAAKIRIQQPGDNVLPTSLLALLQSGGGGSATLNDQIELLRSRGVLAEVIKKANLKTTPDELVNRLRLEPGTSEKVLIIRVRARDAGEAARTANAFANVFREYTRQLGDRQAEDTLAGLRKALRRAESEKNDAVRAANGYAQRIGNVDPATLFGARAASAVETQRTLEGLRRDLDVERQRRDKLIEAASSAAPTVEAGFTQVKNPAIESNEQLVYTLRRERQVKLQDFTPESEEIRDLDRQIAAAQDTLDRAKQSVYSKGSITETRNPEYSSALAGVQTSTVEITRMKAAIAKNEALLARQKNEQKGLTEQRARFEELLTKKNTAVAAYDTVRRGITEIGLKQVSAVPTVSLFEPARPNPVPVSPKPLLNGAMALFLGTFLAVVAALLSEYLATGGDDAARGLPQVAGVPLLGTVPVALPAPSSADGAALPSPVAAHAPQRVEDTLRDVGYSLAHLSHGRKTAPVVVLVGTRTDDTVASVASQLAAILVRDGLRVTLVDADRARPRLNEVFGAPDAPGLAEALAGTVRARDVVHVGVDGNFRFLAAGAPENPAPATERRLRGVFKDLAADADLVLVSGPPAFQAPALGPLQKASDGLVLVAPSDVPATESVARARRLLTNGHPPHILGVVVGEPTEAAFTAKEMI